MSRELTYEGIVLKKQPFGEADEIITFFTRQAGKLRGLAKSVKLPASKLQYALQPVFAVQVTMTRNGNLPKIINASPQETFPGLHESPDALSVWYVIAELLLKALPDEEKNEPLFDLVRGYLQFINQKPAASFLASSLLKFKIDFFDQIGLDIHPAPRAAEPVLFSASRGGFYSGAEAADSRPVASEVITGFALLKKSGFAALPPWSPALEQLDRLVSSFISYQLEREIRSEQFLAAPGAVV